MGHYYSEMRSGKTEKYTCPNCGADEIRDIESSYRHFEVDCIKYLHKRIKKLERQLAEKTTK